MKLENQVTSLELSRQLHEAGITQDSLVYWCEYTYYNDEREITTDWILKDQKQQVKEVGLCMSAFTVAELGEILPAYILDKEGKENYLYSYKNTNLFWCVMYRRWGDEGNALEPKKNSSEAEARGQTLLYLKKQGLI